MKIDLTLFVGIYFPDSTGKTLVENSLHSKGLLSIRMTVKRDNHPPFDSPEADAGAGMCADRRR